MNRLADILLNFDSVSLDDMEKVKLMNRVDTKYVTSARLVGQLLEMSRPDYYVVEIGGVRRLPYYTCYYDTPDSRMYYDHQRGKKDRRKIRIRRYEGNGDLTFLEIKDKNNKGRTKKKRVQLEEGETPLSHADFISKHSEFLCDTLSRKIENHFYRITLVNREMTERVTIDTGIEFYNLNTENVLRLPEIGIIEWKRDGLADSSLMKGFLHSLHINPSGFSKYVMGMALTDPELRCNRIKPRIRNLYKIH